MFSPRNILPRVVTSFNSSRHYSSKLTSGKVSAAILFLGITGTTFGLTTISKYSPQPSQNGITLYEYKICPFCNKVKSTLDYLKIPYSIIEVNPITKSELSFSSSKKVPVARIGDETVPDSNVIISTIKDKILKEDRSKYPEIAEFFSEDAYKWAEWSDSELAIILYPNLTSSDEIIRQALSYVNDIPHFTDFQKMLIVKLSSFFMKLGTKKLLKKHNIVDPRASLQNAIVHFITNLGDKQFLGGDKPNYGDIVIYGTLNGLRDTTLLNDLLKQEELRDWFNRVAAIIGKSSCIEMH